MKHVASSFIAIAFALAGFAVLNRTDVGKKILGTV